MYPSNKASAKADEMILESRDLPPHLLGAPCALCESLAHLLAQAREENERLRRTHTLSIGSDDAMTIRRLAADNANLEEQIERWAGQPGSYARCDRLQQENAALRGLVETLREYAQSLAYEWAWKRDSSLANDREMQALDAAIDAARAALEGKEKR